MTKRSDPRAELAQHLDVRRAELGMDWADFADRVGRSRETLRAIRNDPTYNVSAMRTTTKTGIEDALGWQRGSVDAILRGQKPTPLESFRNEASRSSVLRQQAEMLLARLPDALLAKAVIELAAIVDGQDGENPSKGRLSTRRDQAIS